MVLQMHLGGKAFTTIFTSVFQTFVTTHVYGVDIFPCKSLLAQFAIPSKISSMEHTVCLTKFDFVLNGFSHLLHCHIFFSAISSVTAILWCCILFFSYNIRNASNSKELLKYMESNLKLHSSWSQNGLVSTKRRIKTNLNFSILKP